MIVRSGCRFRGTFHHPAGENSPTHRCPSPRGRGDCTPRAHRWLSRKGSYIGQDVTGPERVSREAEGPRPFTRKERRGGPRSSLRGARAPPRGDRAGVLRAPPPARGGEAVPLRGRRKGPRREGGGARLAPGGLRPRGRGGAEGPAGAVRGVLFPDGTSRPGRRRLRGGGAPEAGRNPPPPALQE